MTERFRVKVEMWRRKAPSYQAAAVGKLLRVGDEFEAEWPTDSGRVAWDSVPCWVHVADAVGGFVEVTNNQGYERAKWLVEREETQ